MNSLVAKLGLLLAAAFVALGVLLFAVAGATGEPARLLDIAAEVAIGGIVFALLAALCVFQLFTRRLQRIVDALDAFQRGDLRAPPRFADADVAGDEIARVAAQVERLAEQVSARAAALDDAARAKRELIANVSHDLRTPLASMQGYLELLLLRHDSLDGTETRNYLQTAVRQSERLGRLVTDLFELTRLEGDGVTAQAEDFAIAELAHDVAQRFDPDARRRDVRLAVRVDPSSSATPLRAHADIALVERVLAGLVENALRHTPGGGSVSIGVEADGGRVRVCVADTGEGIAAADLPCLFDRYYRAERLGGANRVSGHGGLGLAIARRIVDLHGGTLTVDSSAGQGTRIGFDLALADAARTQGEPHRLAA
jgi:signal transduction histidine kinase